MEQYHKMNEVADCLDEQLYDCKEDCKKGSLSGDMLNCIAQTVLNALDNWTPRCALEVLDCFQLEYELCM